VDHTGLSAAVSARVAPAVAPAIAVFRVKALLRKAEARNHPDLLVAIASALNAVTPQDALGWFAACGYNFI
jgi:hypothetical protein